VFVLLLLFGVLKPASFVFVAWSKFERERDQHTDALFFFLVCVGVVCLCPFVVLFIFLLSTAERKALLHQHGLFWAEIDPMVVSRHIHKKEFRERLLKHVESIISCEIGAEVVEKDAMQRKTKQPPVPHGMHDLASLDGARARSILLQPNNEQLLTAMAKDIDQAADTINAATCFHCHTFTCHPKKFNNCPRCRLDMGRTPSAESRFVSVDWSLAKCPTRPGERLTRVKIRDEWTFGLGNWSLSEMGNRVGHPIGTVVTQATKSLTADVLVTGTLKRAFGGASAAVHTVVVETTDGAGFKAGTDVVIGTGSTATVVPGMALERVEKTTEWCMRVKRICSGCKRLLDGGLFSLDEYHKPKHARHCNRCRADGGRCSSCKVISSCPNLVDDNIRLLHAACVSCDVGGCMEDIDGDVSMSGAEDAFDEGVGASVQVQDALVKYVAAVDRVICGSGVVSDADDVENPVDSNYVRALELLRCRNIMGYHGAVVDRLIEMNEVTMWPPMVEAAGAHLYSVIVTSGAAQQQCEEYLLPHGLSGVVRYLSARDLEKPADCPRRAVAMGDGDGNGYRILMNHVPRRNHSIRPVLDHLFGETVLCLDEDDARALMVHDFGEHQPKTIYMCKVESRASSAQDDGADRMVEMDEDDDVVEEGKNGAEGASGANEDPAPGEQITLWCERSEQDQRVSLYHATVSTVTRKKITIVYRLDGCTQPLDRVQFSERLHERGWVNLREHLEGTPDVAAQCTVVHYEVGTTSIMKKGRAVADWYNFVFVRENLQRALLDDHEEDMFRYHELNPPSDLVVIDPPPATGTTFRGKFMEILRDSRCIALHPKRTTHRARYQSEASPLGSALLKCNTLMSPMLTLVSAKAAMHYLSKYFQKNSCKVKDTLVLYHKCLQLMKKYPSRAAEAAWDPERRRANNLITKLLNKTNGSCEYTSTQVAQMLLGHNSRYCSHGTCLHFVCVRCCR
jgi:hypothetical protein